MKTCTVCGETKETSEFYTYRYKYKGSITLRLTARCKKCARKAATGRRKKNPEDVRRAYLKMYYNTTPEWYDSQLERQGGKCALCPRDVPGGKSQKWFCIDHDHSCCPGQVTCGKCTRGLLCAPCNTRLGWLENHEEKLQKYLNFEALTHKPTGKMEGELEEFPTRITPVDKTVNRYNKKSKV